jgi:hypothetical protein
MINILFYNLFWGGANMNVSSRKKNNTQEPYLWLTIALNSSKMNRVEYPLKLSRYNFYQPVMDSFNIYDAVKIEQLFIKWIRKENYKEMFLDKYLLDESYLCSVINLDDQYPTSISINHCEYEVEWVINNDLSDKWFGFNIPITIEAIEYLPDQNQLVRLSNGRVFKNILNPISSEFLANAMESLFYSLFNNLEERIRTLITNKLLTQFPKCKQHPDYVVDSESIHERIKYGQTYKYMAYKLSENPHYLCVGDPSNIGRKNTENCKLLLSDIFPKLWGRDKNNLLYIISSLDQDIVELLHWDPKREYLLSEYSSEDSTDEYQVLD